MNDQALRGLLLASVFATNAYAASALDPNQILGEDLNQVKQLETKKRITLESNLKALMSQARRLNQQLSQTNYPLLEKRVIELQTNDEGRRLSENPALMIRYFELSQKLRRVGISLNDGQARLNESLNALEQGAGEGNYEVSDVYKGALEQQFEEARATLAQLQQIGIDLDALLAAGSPPKPTTPTLKEGLTRMNAERITDEAKREQIRQDEFYKAQQGAKDAANAARITAELARMAALQAADRERLEAENREKIERMKSDSRANELRRKAEDANIQRKFSYFLGKANFRMVKRDNFFQPENQAEPNFIISLSDLKKVAFSNTRLGVHVFFNAACKSRQGDSLCYDQLRNTHTDNDLAKIREEFITLAPFWVEMGLLGP